MADLAQLQSGVSAPAYQTKALNLGQDPPTALPPNTSKLSAAQGHAALMGTVAKTLSELPNLIMGNYVKGKTIPNQLKANEMLGGVLGGQTPDLPAGTSVTPEGVSYKSPGPNAAALAQAELQDKQADVALKQKHAKYYDSRSGMDGSATNPLAAVFESQSQGLPSPDGNGDTPIGTATSYGYKGDTFGGPASPASTTGPLGNPLDSNSLAVSPDIEKQLVANGYKLGDTVTFHTQGGGMVTRRWDDRTAQYDPTGKWSVADGGKYISKVDGKAYANLPESQRLPALTGRFDFHAGTDGKPSKYNGVQITGIQPKNGALSGADAPAPAAPAAPVPALADGAQPALASDGMPVSLDGSEPIQESTPVASDGTVNADAAASSPGIKVSDSGHHGGPVYKLNGMYVEHGEDGGVYGYPTHSPDGSIKQIVLKKPSATGVVPAKIKSEAMQMGVWKENMTGEEASKAMEDKQINEGVIPPHLLPAAESMARFVVGHPALKHIPEIRQAKEVVDSGLKNSGAGGFSDMALIEGFQRMVNPGATVRTQTMTNMKEAAGWLQQIDPTYQWNKATQGDKLTPEARTRLKTLSDDIYNRAMQTAGPQMAGLKKVAKSYGITNPDPFIDNVMVMAPLYGESGSDSPVAPSTPAAQNPNDAAAAEWLKANPTNPKAAAVKAALQAKGIAAQ